MTDTTTTLPAHETLPGAAPAEVLDRLPAMGRVMVIVRAGGATHERIGPVESVVRKGGAMRLSGACHNAVIELGPIASVGIDRSSVMKDKVYPRLNFRDADGAVLVAIVGMEGLEPFEAALTGFARLAETAEAEPVARIERPDLAESDPALGPFETLAGKEIDVVISATARGVTQRWTGRIEAVKPAMGFLNVMTSDFHLHLEGGSVSGWQVEPQRRIALGQDGLPTGLVLANDGFA